MGPKASEKSSGSSQGHKRKEPSGSVKGNQHGSKVANGRATKRAKTNEAREIDSQPARAGLAAGGELDLQAFLNAREFEINALEGSMRRVKGSMARRSFQQVPREMRRRTASHNAKRLPKRLQNRARREQKDDSTPHVEARERRPTTTRARIRAETAKKLQLLAKRKRGRKLKNAEEKKTKEGAATEGGDTAMDIEKPVKEKVYVQTRPARPKLEPNKISEKPLQSSKYKKRQKKKNWLPTHIWHAKRAKMETMWNFAIPTTPTAKSYRATHRATQEKGAVCWDKSYYSAIRFYGKGRDVKALLEMVPDISDMAAGTRSMGGMCAVMRGNGMAFQSGRQVIFNPPDTTLDNPTAYSEFFCRVHPVAFPSAWGLIQDSIRDNALDVKLEDLRWEIGSIEITGPAATEVLLGVLKPYQAGKGAVPAHAQILTTLGPTTAPAVVPNAAVLSFDIQDPRLEYPPRTYRDENNHLDAFNADIARLRLLADWPADEVTHRSGLFDQDVRFKASCLPSQKSINRRRGERLPGTPVAVTAADPPIPIMLLASRGEVMGSFQGSWTLLAPWKCILPLWYSLMHYPLASGGNPRFGGLEQAKQVKFEQGLPWFPRDSPCSDFGLVAEIEDRVADYKKTPQGGYRRKHHLASGLNLCTSLKSEALFPWGCDWETLFGWRPLKCLFCTVDGKEWGGEDHLPEDGKISTLTVPFRPEEGLILPQWIVDHPMRTELFNAWPMQAKEILNERTPEGVELCKNALLTIRVVMIGRGVPSSHARIYRLPAPVDKSAQDAEIPSTEPATQEQNGSLPPDLREQWLAQVPSNKGKQPRNQMTKGQKKQAKKGQPSQPPRMPANASMETRKQLLAASLIMNNLPYPRPKRDTTNDMDGHPLVPDQKDLIGFVTTGGFNLSLGKGMGIGHVKLDMVAEEVWRLGKGKRNSLEARLCIVRNKGESVGWLAKWEFVDPKMA